MAIQSGGFKRKSKVASEIPDSSLADIAFLLLIFFMVTTVFRTESEREITMPEAEATQKVDEKRKNILHVWVDPDGSVFINDARVPMENISDLVRPLYIETDQKLVVAIRADRSVQYSTINDISEELREGGALRVNFATDFEERLSSARR
ncbi:MAG TPA: biopolymer transporter ExbD [Longimicrobiaceae bacterium]|nr:biopolymer transporter ExbD [Longimicrobiaceae bacterium]